MPTQQSQENSADIHITSYIKQTNIKLRTKLNITNGNMVQKNIEHNHPGYFYCPLNH